MNIKYTNTISVEDYNSLRMSAGWSIIKNDQAEAGFKGSAYVIAAYDEEKIVGTARLIWDGGYAALIKDVLVIPSYQGMGIGQTMMNKLLKFLKDNMKSGWGVTVDLMSATDKEAFYKKFGFVPRPRDRRGAGMDLWLVKE